MAFHNEIGEHACAHRRNYMQRKHTKTHGVWVYGNGISSALTGLRSVGFTFIPDCCFHIYSFIAFRTGMSRSEMVTGACLISQEAVADTVAYTV